MLSATGKHEMKFALANFEVENNSFTRNFLGHTSSGKEFANKYRSCIIDILTPSSTSGITPEVLVTEVSTIEAAVTDPLGQKTPLKKGKNSRKRKTAIATSDATPEGAELPSPEKLWKPNTLDDQIEAHYLGMLQLECLIITKSNHIGSC